MRTRRWTQLVLALLVAIMWLPSPAVSAGPEPSTRKATWEPLGLSGGGAMFTPAISPCDEKLMMVNCDMSGAYISTDGGGSWRMIHHSQLRSNTRCRPAFHPTQPGTIFAVGGWSGGLKVSRDFGLHWEEIGNLPHDLIGEIAIDPGRPDRMLAGTSKEVWRSQDGGNIWTRCEGPRGTAIGFHFDQTSAADRRVCFAATADGIWPCATSTPAVALTILPGLKVSQVVLCAKATKLPNLSRITA